MRGALALLLLSACSHTRRETATVDAQMVRATTATATVATVETRQVGPTERVTVIEEFDLGGRAPSAADPTASSVAPAVPATGRSSPKPRLKKRTVITERAAGETFEKHQTATAAAAQTEQAKVKATSTAATSTTAFSIPAWVWLLAVVAGAVAYLLIRRGSK